MLQFASLQPASAAAAPPYTDPSAVGSIGFCDSSNHPVTSGLVSAAPFVWKSLTSSPAPKGYNVAGSTATLYAFQPRPGVAPADWSGEQLTGTAIYTNPAHPTVQSTIGDRPLADFVGAFPLKWSGYVQLRIYLGAPFSSPYRKTYAATDIQVTGNQWHVVRGNTVACNLGTAVSTETDTLRAASITSEAAPVPSGSAGAHASGAATAGAGAGSTASRSTNSLADGSSPAAYQRPAGGGLPIWLWVLIALTGAGAILTGYVFVRGWQLRE
jgi:hypothetical protein